MKESSPARMVGNAVSTSAEQDANTSVGRPARGKRI